MWPMPRSMPVPGFRLATLFPEDGRPESQIERASVSPARAETGVALRHWKTFSKFRHRSARCQSTFTSETQVETRMAGAEAVEWNEDYDEIVGVFLDDRVFIAREGAALQRRKGASHGNGFSMNDERKRYP
ncbi:hypothetical protein [Burkholderia sp. MSMB2157WGS]|uniref:hypothetical protein n=1 Tax=Burkholderia sp. MSMB2157WGS TaxID=1637928 RepID=UPI0012E3724D|nr:hypothetical protein [Burkholderia sp. MSMB2157WGS]